MITTPYNFVPLSKKVVTPWWATHISHDIPFENAQSGTLELTITAKSPIYVRNSGNDELSFNRDESGFFIPGSSIKGAIRNVLEIVSFGNMANKVDNQRYSVRDFQNDGIYKPSEISKDVYCGWLQKVNGEYFLTDCGKPGRISHKDIDKKCKTSMTQFFSKDEYYKENIEYKKRKVSAKSAHFKYLKFDFSLESEFEEVKSSDPRPIFTFGKGKNGVIVMTGQPGKRFKKGEKWEGKHLEFIFFKSKNEPELVDDGIIKNFLFAYYDHDNNQQKDDWKWRSQQLKNGEKIPVFFRRDPDNQRKILDIGLSFLYKITYRHSINESVKAHQVIANGCVDLSECIFGFVDTKSALKGRVHVGHARLQGNVQVLSQKKEVLSGPKASFYPTYIYQGGSEKLKGDYKTFMDEEPPMISGWKRYPIHFTGVKTNPPPVIKGKVNEKVATKFTPLAEGATFKCLINYHNLRSEELGALVSAITFHNNPGLYHSLGMAKPLGYGKVSINIDNHNVALIEAMKAFECFMEMELRKEKQNWITSEQIVNLFAMAKGSSSEEIDKSLAYMKEPKLFADAKKAKKALPLFAKLNEDLHFEYKSLASTDECRNYVKSAELDIKKFQSLKTGEQISDELIKNLQSALEDKKCQLLNALIERRTILARRKKEEQDRLEQIEREQRKATKAKEVLLQGLDLSEVDFGKSFKSVEQTFIKVVEKYVQQIHGVNNLAKVVPPYLNRTEDITAVIGASKKLWHILPSNEKQEKKTKPRLDRYTKWIGNDAVEELRKIFTN